VIDLGDDTDTVAAVTGTLAGAHFGIQAIPTRWLTDNDAKHNPALATAVDDALDSIDALLAEGRQVVVHCHGGRSRTGLVLAAHLMRHGHSLEEATALLADRWPHAHTNNYKFAAELQRRSK